MGLPPRQGNLFKGISYETANRTIIHTEVNQVLSAINRAFMGLLFSSNIIA